MAEFAIRVPSVEELLDPYSAEPFDLRPLREDVRDRILRAWIDTREERPDHLTVEVPESGGDRDLARRLEAIVRRDLESACEESGNLRIFTRGERREAVVAFMFLVVCLILSSLLDQVTENSALFVGISQGLVVLGWVAMWQPAQQVFTALSLRLSHKRFEELAAVPIEVELV